MHKAELTFLLTRTHTCTLAKSAGNELHIRPNTNTFLSTLKLIKPCKCVGQSLP